MKDNHFSRENDTVSKSTVSKSNVHPFLPQLRKDRFNKKKKLIFQTYIIYIRNSMLSKLHIKMLVVHHLLTFLSVRFGLHYFDYYLFYIYFFNFILIQPFNF